MNDRDKRAITIIGASTLLVMILMALYIYAIRRPPAYAYSYGGARAVTVHTSPTGQKTATIRLNIVPAVNTGPNPTWIGYTTQTFHNPQSPSEFFIPAHALVTVIVHNFDSRTPLRNPFFTLVQGTVGNYEYVNGKRIQVMDPALTSHTFTIPDLGVSVPMEGVANSNLKNFATMKFTFRAPGPGVYRWQCIVPCGFGLYGNGGPMQALGYMDGLISVT